MMIWENGYEVAVSELTGLRRDFQDEAELIDSIAGQVAVAREKVARAALENTLVSIAEGDHIASLRGSAERALYDAREALRVLAGHLNADAADLQRTADQYRDAERAALGHISPGGMLPPPELFPDPVPVIYDPHDRMKNYESIATYLVAHGYSKAAAAGICGCIAGESQGDPDATQIGGGGGRGLIQWTDHDGTHYDVPMTGNRQRDFNAQLPDILQYNENQGAGNVQALNSISDPVRAARFYSENFERPKQADSDVRPDVARSVYQFLNG